MHDALLSVLNLKRSIFGMVIFSDRRIDHKSSNKTLARPQLFFPDLVTERTGAAVFGQLVVLLVLVGTAWDVREKLSFASLPLGFITSEWHMDYGGFVLVHSSLSL